MAVKLNKKILCFIDEYGTAGAGPFYMGAVIVHAREAGRVDKCFSSLLEPNVNEIHAAQLDDGYLQSLLQRFWITAPRDRVVLINQQVASSGEEAPLHYARAVIETVKIGLKRFQKDVLHRETIGNVDLIIDANHHNQHPSFDAALRKARVSDGRFRAVNAVARLDSSASRLLQLADVVAYSRKWIAGGEHNIPGLREKFGIQIP